MLVEVGGVRLIDRAVTAVRGATRTVVVGAPREGVEGVTWAREDPPGGGPVAALTAGLALVEAPVVVLLAADLPFVRAEHLRRLLDQLESDDAVDGVQFVDAEGRDQPLVSAWRTSALRQVLPADPSGAALRRTLAPLSIGRLTGSEDLQDCDTDDDIQAARRLARREAPP
ncbi:MAG: hypothetical protein QOJ32_2483 [Frankiaceae bacterium]|nr:hypothetical protein [Frankiaceae bacterium]MDQ1648491.1 hypothetical protein [Frankiaceae bacterium]